MIHSGTKTVTTAGTRVNLANTLAAGVPQYGAYIEVQAKSTNTGIIYLGGPTVAAANGIELTAGSSYTFSDTGNGNAELTVIYIDASINAQAVNIMVVQQ